ncbi:MAG: 3-hydroxybutyryl-CoA dehydrogenase [Clostridia bacterium]|nr:3-hydroxybutyryl-CoA dehydrogenase [Clostridia bacterium]
MEIRTVGVVGAGTMGRGIAHVAARSGFKVRLYDLTPEILNNSMANLKALLEKSISKGRLTKEAADDILERIEPSSDFNTLSESDFVIEAAVENIDVKKDIFDRLSKMVKAETVLVTNTSSISITEIAKASTKPEKVAGMHFFNPAEVMKLVEVIRGYYTEDQTVKTVFEVAKKMGKEPIEVKRDTPGFVVNRLLIPFLSEAMQLAEEGVASIEDIDKAIKLGLNHPMGPFELADFSGLDVVLSVMEYFYGEFGKSKYAPPLSLKRLVAAGRYGRKNKKGFYEY